MSKIIAIVNQKGGTGKTTTSVNLGAYLAAFGKKILLVDLDSQANSSSNLGLSAEDDDFTVYEILTGAADLKKTIKKTSIFNYDVLISSPDLAGATVELVNLPEREYLLENALNNIKSDYDYILIDCPPSLGVLTVNGLVAADELIIPIQCEYFALEGLGQLLKTVNLINENLEKEIKIKGAVLTMFDRRNRLARAVEKEVRRKFPHYVFETIIPRNVILAEAPSFSKTILQHDPYSHGAKAYRQLAQEIINLDSPKKVGEVCLHKKIKSDYNKRFETRSLNFTSDIKLASSNDIENESTKILNFNS